LRLLFDTHLLLWAGEEKEEGAFDRLARSAIDMLDYASGDVLFSVAIVWEVAIKSSRHPKTFGVRPGEFRIQLIAAGFTELPITGEHAEGVARLPPIHKDPFDRLLIAQATVDGLTLLTADKTVATYPGPIRLV
jgi:PIN domain nuclease of toxin-antitoxin system